MTDGRTRIPLSLPVGVLCAGMLLNAASTVWDLLHLGTSFNSGDSQNGAIAYLLEGLFAWVRLIGTAVLVPVLWVSARNAHRPGSRGAGVVGPFALLLAACGGLLFDPNDGSDPRRLGIVHGPGAPAWITVTDIVAPAMIVTGALGALFLVLAAFVTWWRTPDADPHPRR